MRLSPRSQVRSAITGKNRFPVTIRQIQVDLPRLCACAAEEKCSADLSTHASQPRAQPVSCARSQRTSRADRGPRDGDCQNQGSVARAEELGDDVATAIERVSL